MTELSKESYFGLGRVPIGIGAVLNGWHGGAGSVLDFRAMTEACPHDCHHCFTDKRKKTLEFEDIKSVLDQAMEMGYVGVNYLGEGEPTIDKDFIRIIEYTSRKGLVPVVFTDGATKLRNRDLVHNLYDLGASVFPKCDSLFNEDYQNWVVGDKTKKYFQQRNEAIDNLFLEGFNRRREDGRTRLGIDMVVTKRNVDEVKDTLRFCRENNIFAVFTTYLPSGRCTKENFDGSLALSPEEINKMRQTIEDVGREYGFVHPIFNNFATFPCVEFMQIYGDGRVSPCPGNETIIGNIRTSRIGDLRTKILREFPCHDPKKFDGTCLYRPRISEND
jgi:MoaA/NifB/PqqE/SkfB family radical SAM enzyme